MEKYPKIALRTVDKLLFVHAEEILYALADGNYTEIYLSRNRSVRVLRKLKGVSELLTADHFIRIHRSHLINLEHIQSYEEEVVVVMNDGRRLPVARHRKARLIEKFTKI